MSQSSSGDGIKIAQAAKDLNVTSVTIRRYLSEFNIATTTDENGVKVLPLQSIEELQEIRRLKEEGLTNPKVLEMLEEKRTQGGGTAKPKTRGKTASRAKVVQAPVAEDEESQDESVEVEEVAASRPARQPKNKVAAAAEELESVIEAEATEAEAEMTAPTRSKHSLTCQTCSKVFEHMNPRLRDCLDCYRTKRKERRRGGGDRQKQVIQHPLAQQVATKNVQQRQGHVAVQGQEQAPTTQAVALLPAGQRVSSVRSYRKAIEDTRHITANLKRRLERPDLLEGERRWLEQIYAYELILHQGWRHLSEYRSANREQAKAERNERGERGERPERGERGERPERGERAERLPRAERIERPERAEQIEIAEPTDNSENAST
jgi:DNA-binding transcriptional MerR regulator